MATYSGTIDLRVTGNALKETDLINKRINEIRALTKSLKPAPNLFDKRGNERIVKAKEDLKKLVNEYGKGVGAGRRFSNTLAGLNSQISAFGKIIGNVNTNSDEFVQAITAQEKASRRLARAEADRLRVQTQVNTANTVGRSTSVQETLDLGKIIPKSVAGLELYQRELQDTLRNVRIGSQDYQDLARAIADVNRQLAVAQGQGPIQGPALPAGFNERGRIAEPGRRGSRFQDIATGAGFPLLFGGGPAQALAGGIGGAFGGLGGSIAASAIASQVEAFAQAATEAGQALNSTGGALDFMREKSLFSTAQVEENAAVLEEQGRVQELAALLTQELTEKIGNEGVRSLQKLGETTDETTRLWSELTTQLFALISGPLNDFLKIVNQVLGNITGRGRFEAVQKDFAGNEAFEAAVLEIRKANGRGAQLGALQTKDQQALVARAQAGEFGQVARPAQIPVTAADQRRFTGKDTAGDKAAREEARIQQRLAALEVERQKILEISRFKDKIAAAEAAQDAQLVIRLQGEQRVAQIEAKRLTDLTKVKDQRVIDAININAATEKLAAQRETERQITEEQRQRQELFETTIEGLEHQLEMTEATSQAERDRLKIARELKKLDDKGFSDAQLGQAEAVMEQLAVAQQPLNAFIRKTTEDLNNLQQVAVDVSQGIGNAIGNSLTNGLQNLITGAKSVKEIFADMLKSIADVLFKQAAQMIATYIAIGVARAFAGLGGNSGSSTPDPFSANVASALPDTGSLADVAASTPLALNAAGSYVSGPTATLVGEGGQGEYIIPESKMRESMARYSRGARGSAVVPEAGASGTSGEGGGTAVATQLDVRFNVERINNVDYVTAEEFQIGMQRAAAQGAQRGQQLALTRLQQSPNTRRKLGL